MLDGWGRFLGDWDSLLQVAYILACVAAIAAVFGNWPLGSRGNLPDEAPDRLEDEEDRLPVPISNKLPATWHRVAEQPGPGAILHLLVFAGTALAALIGWRIPAEIERLYGDGAGFGLIFPNVTMPAIGRLAQVIGAVTFALIALRLLRFLIPVMALALTLCLAILAIQYVVGWPVGLVPMLR